MPRPIIVLLVLICAFCYGCGGSAHKPSETTWYKHYTGTVGGAPVEVDLIHYAGKYIGGYTYQHKSVLIDLTNIGEVTDKTIELNEFVRSKVSDQYYDDSTRPDHWLVAITGNTIKGTWVSGNGKRKLPIELTENYPEGCNRFSLWTHNDDAKAKVGITNTTALSAWQWVVPDEKMEQSSAQFLKEAVLNLLNTDHISAKNIEDLISKTDHTYFLNYRKLMKDANIDKEMSPDETWQYNFDRERNIFVLHNANDIICLEQHTYDYSGGGSGHGNSSNSYACLDMRTKKVLKLKDIISVDPTRLEPMLDHEARKMFAIPEGTKLSERLITDKIDVTENILLSETGITFCYNPMTIGTEPDGEVCIFLPYSRLKDILKPEFRKRMGLQ